MGRYSASLWQLLVLLLLLRSNVAQDAPAAPAAGDPAAADPAAADPAAADPAAADPPAPEPTAADPPAPEPTAADPETTTTAPPPPTVPPKLQTYTLKEGQLAKLPTFMKSLGVHEFTNDDNFGYNSHSVDSYWPVCGIAKLPNRQEKGKRKSDKDIIDVNIKCIPGPNEFYKTTQSETLTHDRCNLVVECMAAEKLQESEMCQIGGEYDVYDMTTTSSTSMGGKEHLTFNLDPDCPREAAKPEYAPGAGPKKYFRFMTKIAEHSKQFTRDLLGKNEDKRNLYVKTSEVELGVTHPTMASDLVVLFTKDKSMGMYDVTQRLPNIEGIKCGFVCDYGRTIHYDFKSVKFDLPIFVTKKCDWVQVCTHPDKDTANVGSGNWGCKRSNMITIGLRNQFVAFGLQNGAIPLRFAADLDQEIIKFDLSKFSTHHVAVTNSFGERVVSNTQLYQSELRLRFSHPDCLAPDIGIAAKIEGYVIPDDAEDKKNILKNINEYREGTALVLANLDTVVDEYTDAPEITTTEDKEAAVTTTRKPPVASAMQGQLTNNLEDEMGPQEMDGWMTFAIFVGFFTGSLTGVVISGVFFYFCRRSIFGIWYRGMYKRYGCDASGTTGGVTGASFGETTQGGTLASTSQMSTIGGTTGGGTTGGATETMSSNMSSATETTGGGTTGGGSTMVTM